MARARNIKPGFFKNEDLAECSPWARLCFAGLWTLADREGRLEDRPKRIKGELFAFDSVEVEPLLQELARHGFVLRYSAAGGNFIQILTFDKHQNPHHKEPASVIPSPQNPGLDPHAMNAKPEARPMLHGVKAPDKPEASPGLSGDERAKDGGQTVLIPDSGSLIPDSGEKLSEATPPPASSKPPDCPHQAVLALWAEVLPHMPQHLPTQWRGTRAEHLRARWRETAVEKRWASEADGLAYLRKLFAYVGQSRFLTGRVPSRDPGKPAFQIELEWLVNPSNWAKVIEGKYHQEAA